MEKVLVYIKDQTTHNIPLSYSLIQTKTLAVFSSTKADRGEEASEEKSEASRVWFMRFEERSCLHNIKVQGEAASADVEAGVIYSGDRYKISKGGYTKNRFSMYMKQPHLGRRCNLGL